MKKIVFTIVFLLSSLIGMNQMLKSDGFKLSYTEFGSQAMGMHGTKGEIHKGIIKVKTRGVLKGEYPFYFAEMGNTISTFTIKNKENKIVGKLLYLTDKNTFIYSKGSPDEKILDVKDTLQTKDLILRGMLFWLQLQKDMKTKEN